MAIEFFIYSSIKHKFYQKKFWIANYNETIYMHMYVLASLPRVHIDIEFMELLIVQQNQQKSGLFWC